MLELLRTFHGSSNMQAILNPSHRYGSIRIIRHDTRFERGALIGATMPSFHRARNVGKSSLQLVNSRVSVQRSVSVYQTNRHDAITSKLYQSRPRWSINKSSMISNEFGLGPTLYRVYSISVLANEPAGQKHTIGMSNPQAGNGNNATDDKKDSKAPPINQRATAAIIMQLTAPPNILTLSRIVATPYLSSLLVSHHHLKMNAASKIDNVIDFAAADATTMAAADASACITTNIDPSSTPVFALSLFLAMGFTDYLDGYIARKFPSTATVLGTYLDPFADKMFIGVMSLTLWYVGTLPGLLVGVWVARDVGMLGAAYWMVRAETLKRSKNKVNNGHDAGDSIAIMDPTSTPLKVQANFLSKVNTSLQIGLIAMGIAGDVPSISIPSELQTTLCWVTAGTTIGSSAMYLDGSALLKSGNKNS